ncbi:MAG TPA: hypothetical protein VMU61_17840 [Candidatus Aquilonibacter sp.]|nr:hypothetical protein [Candidatus Aquilonibacter sp.]
MNAFFVPLLLFLTVVTSVSFGVLAAYAAVFAILHSFGRPSRPEPKLQQPRLVLIPSQNQASGD